ncbi:MAG TPA: VanZ family protein [Burkholderiaceae bacterium]|nr:VanZ family protein [Burkholderiaceae bacterium]
MNELPAESAPHHGSPLARWSCLAWVAMTVYASLTPFSNWQDRGVSPWSYIVAPWPAHVTAFDVAVNVAGYVPLGALIVLALHPRLRGVAAVVVATLAGLLLSATVEAIQTYLPSRVASNVDVMTNTLGALLGAGAAARFATAIVDRGRIVQLRRRWFRSDDALGLTLAALWPLAQVHPSSALFGIGHFEALPALVRNLEDVAGFDGPNPVIPLVEASDFVLAEAAITTTGLLAAGLGIAATLQRHAPRVALLVAWIAVALGCRIAAYGVAFGPENAFAWSTRGALGGLLLGGFSLLAASTAPARLLPRLALTCTMALLLEVNLVPENPYHEAWLQQWSPGHLRNLDAAAAWLATLWPVAWLAWAVARRRGAPRAAPRTGP